MMLYTPVLENTPAASPFRSPLHEYAARHCVMARGSAAKFLNSLEAMGVHDRMVTIWQHHPTETYDRGRVVGEIHPIRTAAPAARTVLQEPAEEPQEPAKDEVSPEERQLLRAALRVLQGVMSGKEIGARRLNSLLTDGGAFGAPTVDDIDDLLAKMNRRDR